MSHRKVDIAALGYTEESWKALDENYKRHLIRRAYYHRNIERAREYQRNYWRQRNARLGSETESHS